MPKVGARVQGLIVWLDRGPVSRLFGLIYDLGLWVLLRRLKRISAVHSVYGCGSYFEGGCLHGHSDIDLIIVLDPSIARVEGTHGEVARQYDRVRRFFPFLGQWDEKEGSLIFLEEIEGGFPWSDSFTLRWKQGRLRRLMGPELPFEIARGPIDGYDVVCEMSTLLRGAFLSGEDLQIRQIFWKRQFTKLKGLAESIGVDGLGNFLEARAELAFLSGADRDLFFGRSEPEELFPLLLQAVGELAEAIRQREPAVSGHFIASGSDTFEIEEMAPSIRARALTFASGVTMDRARAVRSIPLGLEPKLFFFPVNGPMTVMKVRGNPYRTLRRLTRTFRQQAEEGETVAYDINGMLVVFSRQSTYVEVVYLDPLRYADTYAFLQGATAWERPQSVDEGLRRSAEQYFAALQGAYRRHDGWMPNAPYPCIYREEDLDTISTAFAILRSYVFYRESICLMSTVEIVRHFMAKYPESTDFLDALSAYHDFLNGFAEIRPKAGNLFRVLHQFMVHALGQDEEMELDDPNRQLDITVGLITRNRADDLPGALESLRMQTRPPDEIVVVDNGSTDDTRTVISRYEELLPIRYLYLPDASIPLARNLVIDEAGGEVIAFTDDDAACEQDWLASVERGFLRADNVGIVGGWVEHWPAENDTMVDAYYEIFHNHKT